MPALSAGTCIDGCTLLWNMYAWPITILLVASHYDTIVQLGPRWPSRPTRRLHALVRSRRQSLRVHRLGRRTDLTRPRLSQLASSLHSFRNVAMIRMSAFVRASGPVLAGLIALAGTPVGNAAPPPNIVVVMTDDLDDGSFQILLAMGLLPNIKSTIVNRGVRFSNSFATHPLCAPSRATFLTGQYAHNHGVLNNAMPIGGVARLVDTSTIATALPHPYRKGHVGKYLNQYGNVSTA